MSTNTYCTVYNTYLRKYNFISGIRCSVIPVIPYMTNSTKNNVSPNISIFKITKHPIVIKIDLNNHFLYPSLTVDFTVI